MKYSLVGYNDYQITNKETGKVTECCTLYLVRKPTLRESGAVGNVTVAPTVYGEAVDKLPVLEVGANYECDINSYKSKHYLNDIVKL